MSMSIPVAQMRLSREMQDAETALDEALLKQASLLATMLHARRETGVGPFTGQAALMRLAKSQQTLLSAGNDLARVHGGLLDIQVETGGLHECPPNEPMGFSNDEAATA